MEPTDPQEFKDREAWRSWLSQNHDSVDSLWVITHKKADTGPGLRYIDGVEEALCFGWIDGQIRGVDDKTFVQRYTPRRKNSPWSAANRERVSRLEAAGLMAPAGLAEVEAAKADGRWDKAWSNKKPAELTGELAQALESEPEALETLNSFANTYRNIYIHWVTQAKTSATREKRIAEVVERLRRGLKPGEPAE